MASRRGPADRPASAAPTRQYFAAAPQVPSREREVTLDVPGIGAPLPLATDRGVFSPGRLDDGTRLLLEHGARPDPATTGVLVDAGCGYGPIAVALARWAPAAQIWAVDVNERARDLCRRNVARAGEADRVRIMAPDDVPAGPPVAGVWSNPPIRVGKRALHELLLGWLGRLDDRGAAHLVVHKHLGSDSLARWLADQGWTVERRRSRGGYRLLDVGPAPRS